jgi:membrane protein YdbS with pleckstrin-like domain
VTGVQTCALPISASVIWEKDDWSIAKQTGIYFLISAIAMLPIAYFAHWMPRSLAGFLSYFTTFIVIFIVIWVIQYCIWKNKIQRINKGINERK